MAEQTPLEPSAPARRGAVRVAPERKMAWSEWGPADGAPVLFSPGAAYATAAFRLFDSLPWWKLRPSGTGPGYAGRDLVLAGRGTRGPPDYVTAALAEGGTHLLAYVPPAGAAPPSSSVQPRPASSAPKSRTARARACSR